MAKNLGTKFEEQFERDIVKVDGITFNRIYNVSGMRRGVRNVCDFICYKYPNIFYAETKSVKGNTFPLRYLTQYEKLLQKKDIYGAIAGVIIWYYEKDKVVFCPIKNVQKIVESGAKSIHLIKHKDMLLEIPSVKKKVFMTSDYSVIFENWRDENEFRTAKLEVSVE